MFSLPPPRHISTLPKNECTDETGLGGAEATRIRPSLRPPFRRGPGDGANPGASRHLRCLTFERDAPRRSLLVEHGEGHLERRFTAQLLSLRVSSRGRPSGRVVAALQ